MEALRPVKLSTAMRRKLAEFKGERSIVATTKNGSRNIHPTISALEARGLVKIQPLPGLAHRIKVAVLTGQGQAYVAAIVERAEAIYAERHDTPAAV